ncbi:MAG: hypothetical protein QM696_08750 [Steroidobacteraceae bacterium]
MRPYLAALLSLLLLPAVAAAQSEGANVMTLVNLGTSTVTDKPINGRGELLLANDGNFYITSYGGGANSGGAVARIAPDGTLTTLHSFASGSEGAQSYARLVQASDGNLYGTTYLGGDDGAGTVFRVSLSGDFATLHAFGKGKRDPKLPYTGLVQAGDGNLYGTTLRGGAADRGTVFRISLSGTVDIIHEFADSEGESPEGTLVVGPDGNLYGTTMTGGENERGTIYRITLGGDLTTLYSFPAGPSSLDGGVAINDVGANPRAGLMLGSDGNFYGTAYQGGTSGYGTVFRMTPAGNVVAFHHFSGSRTDGAFPLAGVTQDAAGNLYGTTEKGGILNRGTVWQVSPAGQFTLLHGFIGGVEDGSTPYAGVTVVGDAVYGVTYTDSVYGTGAVFQLDRGTGGVLPVRIAASPSTVMVGDSATLTWDTTGAASCTASGSWADTQSLSGSLALKPATAGIYNYVLSCTDGAGIQRHGFASLSAQAPASEPVDGNGGGGGGGLHWGALLLLGALLRSVKGRRAGLA